MSCQVKNAITNISYTTHLFMVGSYGVNPIFMYTTCTHICLYVCVYVHIHYAYIFMNVCVCVCHSNKLNFYATSVCIMWTIWREWNNSTFHGVEFSMMQLKSFF